MKKTEYDEKVERYTQEMEKLHPKEEKTATQQKEERINKNVRKRKKKRKRKFLRFLFFVAFCVGMYYFLRSDFFTVEEIEITGNQHYTKAQILELSKLRTGLNLFEPDLIEARDNLLQDPYIRVVHTKRKIPSAICLDVEERIEYAAVPYGEQFILIDEDGLVLRLCDNEPVLPQLLGMTINDMTAGKPLKVDQTYLLTDTLRMIAVMEENDLFFKRINFSAVVVKAYIYDDYYIEGTPENITQNMQSIHQLVNEHYKQGITKGVIKVSKGEYLAFNPQID